MQKPENLTTLHTVKSKGGKSNKRETKKEYLEQGRDKHTWGHSYLQTATEKKHTQKIK